MPTHFKPSAAVKSKSRKGKGTGTGGASTNRIRIIGGTWRSRMLEFPDAEGLRPTANRVRETLFNWLGQTLLGKRCLDLFSGSGALGFEAASRGATECVMLENFLPAVEALKLNQRKLGATTCHIVTVDTMKFIDRSSEKFDIVFVDPPFGSILMEKVLQKLPDRLVEGGLIYAEWGEPVSKLLKSLPGEPWEIVKQGRAGAVHFALIRPTLKST